jgi:DNA repair exonuclease SbcCD nuclease subunit
MLKVLHTADTHIGREFPFLREKGREYKNQLLTTFELIIDSAISANVVSKRPVRFFQCSGL